MSEACAAVPAAMAERGSQRARRGVWRALLALALAACGAPRAPVASPATSEAVQAPEPVKPPLTAEERAALEAAYQAAQKQLAGEWAALLQLEQAGRLPPATAAMVKRAHAERAAAMKLREAGDAAGAAAAMQAAWEAASSANAANTAVRLVVAGNAAGALARLAVPERPPLSAAGEPIDVVVALRAALHFWAQSALAGEMVRVATEVIAHDRSAAERNAPALADAVAAAVIRALQATRAEDAARADLVRVLAPPR